MSIDLHDYRIVTASAYAGMMAPLLSHPSAVCALSGDADNERRPDAVAAVSLEELDGVRRRWRLGDVARLADFVPKVLARDGADDRPALVVPPRVTPAWEQAAAAWPHRLRLLGQPAQVVCALADDKVYVREALRRLDVPIPDSVVGPAGELAGDYDRLLARLGSPFVVQRPRGAGGQGTFLVHDAERHAAVLAQQDPDGPLLVSAFAGDLTVNVAGVVYPDGVEVLPLSVQTSGIAELGAGYGNYCGSDFGAVSGLPRRLREDAYSYGARIGDWLRDRGHRGLFGVDIAVAGDRLRVLEVNPRIQGSSWLLSHLEERAGGTGCLLRHAEALLGRELGAPLRPPSDAGPGSHLMLRWTGGDGVVVAVPPAGEHGVRGLAYPVLISALPAPGTIITRGAIAARIESPASLAAPGGNALTEPVRSFLGGLRDRFEVTSRPSPLE